MARENQLIERVRRKLPTTAGGLRVGIGDDAAVIAGPRTGVQWVVTTDAFLENVHFFRRVHPPESVGYKALARATSDIAAMGARGRYFFLTLGLPAECTGTWLDGFLGGMARAARQFGLVLAGGDTTSYQLVVSSLTVTGEIGSGRAVLRCGARPGDLLCVSGRLGEAELGLRLVQRAAVTLKRMHKDQGLARLTKKHFYPEPRLALGHWLATEGIATAMIDTSDGLSTDLGHICEASEVGATVWAQKIPVVEIPPELQGRDRAGPSGRSRLSLNPFELALHGGEDYELLFTVPKKLAGQLPNTVGRVPITVIGEITRSKRIAIVDEQGRPRPLRSEGWDPFRNPRRR